METPISPNDRDDSSSLSADFRLRFDGGAATRHKMPANELAHALEALQKAVYFLAMDHEGHEFNQRARVPSQIARSYTVLCETPQEGSYAVPFEIASTQPDLLSSQDIHAVAEKFTDTLKSLSQHALDDLRRIVPDGALRRRLISALIPLLPKSGSNLRLFIDDLRSQATVPVFEFSESHAISLRQFTQQAENRDATQTVTGRLEAIDFAERKVTLFLPVANRSISCTYEEGIEEMLIENRRDRIQVTGQVELRQEENTPYRITNVVSISSLDLSPFEISQVRWEQIKLQFAEPLRLEPTMDESQQLICLSDETLGIAVFAQTREQLLAELNEQIAMLWREFAQEDDQNLSPSALALKQQLKSHLRPIEEIIANAA